MTIDMEKYADVSTRIAAVSMKYHGEWIRHGTWRIVIA